MRLLGVLAVVLLLVGCTTQDADQPLEPAWQRVDLPAPFVASQVVVVDGHLVVGGSADGEGPALVAGADTGAPEFVPITSTTFYGARARWYSLVVAGSELRALGGRTGGGHGNPRWSTWLGDLENVEETHTPGIETFGGPRGGGMVGVAVVEGRAVIAGGRVGEQAGLDIAVWLEQGDTWVEQPSAGTALEATDTVLPFPSNVVAAGDTLLITGFTQVLGGGEVHSRAAVWIDDPFAAEPTTAWQRIDLPDASSGADVSGSEASEATADSAICIVSRCIVAGRSDGELLIWSVSGDEAAALPIPAVEVGDADVPAPVIWSGRTTVVAADGDAAVIAVATTGDLSTWEVRVGPAGIPIAAAASGAVLYVLVATADGSVELWSTTATS